MSYPTTAAKTTHARGQVIKWAVTTAEVTRPTAWYVALHTEDPTVAGNVGEVSTSGTGYGRQAATYTMTATAGVADNDAEVSFTASGSAIGPVTHWSLWDAETGGNAWYRGELDEAETINDGSTLTFAAGSLTITEE